jgi:hypothetical protein
MNILENRKINMHQIIQRKSELCHFPKFLFYYLAVLSVFLQISPILSQLLGSEKTMEQFLDRLLHESVYDRRIRPFYTESKSNQFAYFIFLLGY